ncbi:hypothetical protein BJV78DRAFT_1283587 [Lactifluus subvellereus]|nr:hypothetical protein BJV78DRAFT_1283587 [Lactifluus subvellereus]
MANERFFAGIAGFCNSKVLVNPMDAFKAQNGEEISEALVGFMPRTLLPDLDLALDQPRKDMTSAGSNLPPTNWESQELSSYCLSIASPFVCTIDGYSEHDWDIDAGSRRSKCLEIVSKLDVRSWTHEILFLDCNCLWNDLINMTEKSDQRIRSLGICILRHIRNICFDLHQGTDAASTSFCIFEVIVEPTVDTALPFSPPFSTTLTTPLSALNPARTSLQPIIDESSSVDVPDAPQRTIPVATTSSPTYPRSNSLPLALQDIASGGATHAITLISESSSINPIPRSTFYSGAAPQHSKETSIIPPTVPDTVSSPTLMPAPRSVPSSDVHSPADSGLNRSVSSDSHPSTTSSLIAPPVAPSSDPNLPPLSPPIRAIRPLYNHNHFAT